MDLAGSEISSGLGCLLSKSDGKVNACIFQPGRSDQSVAGRVDVMEKSVRIELDLPWALAALAETLQRRVRSAGTLLLQQK